MSNVERQRLTPRPTLWVDDSFGRDVQRYRDEDQRTGERISRRRTDIVNVWCEQEIWDIFAKYGVRINRWNLSSNEPYGPRDVGIGSQRNSYLNFLERNQMIFERVGAKTPQEYTWQEMLASTEPVVLKIPNNHRGEGKFFLQTHRDKLKVAALILLNPEVVSDIYTCPDHEDRDRRLEAIFNKIERGEVDGPEFREKDNLWYVTLQKYINTPSSRYTSFRFLVDAFGVLHSALLLYSANDKSDRIAQPKVASKVNTKLVETYLLTPDSSFYLESTTSIVSNYARGGDQINLLHPQVPKSDDVAALQRKILIAHGFDPDYVRIPPHVLHLVERLGIEHRKEYPWTGVDLIIDEENLASNPEEAWLVVELNSGPSVDREDIGITLRDSKHIFASLEVAERVADEMVYGVNNQSWIKKDY